MRASPSARITSTRIETPPGNHVGPVADSSGSLRSPPVRPRSSLYEVLEPFHRHSLGRPIQRPGAPHACRMIPDVPPPARAPLCGTGTERARARVGPANLAFSKFLGDSRPSAKHPSLRDTQPTCRLSIVTGSRPLPAMISVCHRRCPRQSVARHTRELWLDTPGKSGAPPRCPR